MVGSIEERHRALGAAYDAAMGWAAVERCNCMVRFSVGGMQLPAIRSGKTFTTPEGRLLGKPASFEDMKSRDIIAMMMERGEVYIGHMFGEMKPA